MSPKPPRAPRRERKAESTAKDSLILKRKGRATQRWLPALGPGLRWAAVSGGAGWVYLEVIFLDLFGEDRASDCCRGGTRTPFCLS